MSLIHPTRFDGRPLLLAGFSREMSSKTPTKAVEGVVERVRTPRARQALNCDVDRARIARDVSVSQRRYVLLAAVAARNLAGKPGQGGGVSVLRSA